MTRKPSYFHPIAKSTDSPAPRLLLLAVLLLTHVLLHAVPPTSAAPTSDHTGLTIPIGQAVTYFTARSRVQSVADWNAKETGYTYDHAGRLTAIDFPNGVSGSLGYDGADRLTSVAYLQGTTNLESISDTRDAVGDPTAMTDSAGSTTYGYDALDRLTSAAYPDADAVAYGYDAVGNRTSLTVNGVQATSTFDAADRLTQAGSTVYTYDTNGNELTKTAGGVTTTYSYDPLGRLMGISGPTTAGYQYNGDGLRVAKTVNGATTSYAWIRRGWGACSPTAPSTSGGTAW